MTVTTNSVIPEFVEDLSMLKVPVSVLKGLIDSLIARGSIGDEAEIVEKYTLPEKGQVSLVGGDFSCKRAYISEILGREKDLLGYHEINGFGFLGFNSDDVDGLCPIYGIIYLKKFDTNFSIYIPAKGNIFNPETMAVYGCNNDYEEGDLASCDYDSIMEDIKTAFNLDSVPIETAEGLEEIKDSMDDLVEAISALTDDSIREILETRMRDVTEKIEKVIGSSTSSTLAELSYTRKRLLRTEVELKRAKKENEQLKLLIPDIGCS